MWLLFNSPDYRLGKRRILREQIIGYYPFSGEIYTEEQDKPGNVIIKEKGIIIMALLLSSGQTVPVLESLEMLDALFSIRDKKES